MNFKAIVDQSEATGSYENGTVDGFYTIDVTFPKYIYFANFIGSIRCREKIIRNITI